MDWSDFDTDLSNHPAFAAALPEDGKLSDAFEAIQALKYDEGDPPEEKAVSFKNEGNKNFQYKKYNWAINAYTEGIKQECRDKEINASLYGNRAAAHVRLGNYLSAAKDCICARKFNPNHEKVIQRGIDCFMKLGRYQDAIDWCNDFLMLCPSDSQPAVLDIKSKAEQLLKVQQRDKRKKKLDENKELEAKLALMQSFRDRNIRFYPNQQLDVEEFDFDLLAHDIPGQTASGCRVHLTPEDGSLSWPVLFLYPEYGQTDFVQEYHEDCSFGDMLRHMFSDGAAPVWDPSGLYVPGNLLEEVKS